MAYTLHWLESCSAPSGRASRTRGRADSSRRAGRGSPGLCRPDLTPRTGPRDGQVFLDVATRPRCSDSRARLRTRKSAARSDRMRGTHVETQEAEGRQVARAQHAVEPPVRGGICGRGHEGKSGGPKGQEVLRRRPTRSALHLFIPFVVSDRCLFRTPSIGVGNGPVLVSAGTYPWPHTATTRLSE